MTPKCPFCGAELVRVGESLASESWGCEARRADGSPCGTFVNRSKPPENPKPALTAVGQIAPPKEVKS